MCTWMGAQVSLVYCLLSAIYQMEGSSACLGCHSRHGWVRELGSARLGLQDSGGMIGVVVVVVYVCCRLCMNCMTV
jgi:hypothetical protein